MSARILQQNSYRQWGTKKPFYARVSTMSPQKSCDIFCHNKHTSIPECVLRKIIRCWGCWRPTVMARTTHRAMLDAMLDLPPTAAYTPLLQVRSCISNLDVQYNYAVRFLNCFSSSANIVHAQAALHLLSHVLLQFWRIFPSTYPLSTLLCLCWLYSRS